MKKSVLALLAGVTLNVFCKRSRFLRYQCNLRQVVCNSLAALKLMATLWRQSLVSFFFLFASWMKNQKVQQQPLFKIFLTTVTALKKSATSCKVNPF